MAGVGAAAGTLVANIPVDTLNIEGKRCMYVIRIEDWAGSGLRAEDHGWCE